VERKRPDLLVDVADDNKAITSSTDGLPMHCHVSFVSQSLKRRSRFFFAAAALVIAYIAALDVASAQDYRRYQPQTLPVPLVAPQVPEKPVEPVTGSDAVLVESWNALRVVDRTDKIEPLNGFEELSGLNYDVDDQGSLVLRDEFRQIVTPYFGGPITLRRVNELSREIILYYLRHGRPVVDVVIPEQKITDGTVQIIVIEARIGKVCVEGGCWFDACMLRDQLECTRPGDRLSENKLRSDLFWLNRSAFRRVEVDLRPGSEPGTTDVIFDVRDAAPWRAYAGYEDTGVPALGIDRVYGGFIWGDAFKRDGLLSYQFTSDTDFDNLQAHAYNYQRALNREWTVQQYGAMSDVSALNDPVAQDGKSWIVGGALLRYFNYDPCLQSWLTLGFDFKSTNNNLEFGGVPVVGGRADFWELNLGFDRQRRFNDVSYWLFASDLFVGPNGGLSAFNDAASFNTIRTGTTPGFVYERAKVEGVVELPLGMQLLGRSVGQVASQRLLWSEMLGFGGYDSIRGYDQRTFNADVGYFTNLELGPRTWIWGSRYEPKSLRAFAFFDYGGGYVRNPQPGDVVSETLASVGAGFRFAWSDRTSVRFDYGYGLSDVVGATNDHRAHVGVVYVMGPRPRR
jgi:hemolysin activation/secretion protein